MGEWYPCGTGQGFADWLYVYGQEEDLRLLGGLRRTYIASWMEYSIGPGANAIFAEEAAKREETRIRNEKVSREASTLVTQLKGSPRGRLAFSALRALATSAGRSLGHRKHTVASLEMLNDFREQLWKVFRQLDVGMIELAMTRFPSFRARDWVDFGTVERQLSEEPLHKHKVPQQSVVQLIAVCLHGGAKTALETQLTALRMQAVIDRRVAPASAADPRRSRVL